MSRHSRSTLFLIEQLIVVAVFAICSAACVRILTSAYFTARDSRDLSNALLVAEQGAESFKAVSGDIGKVADILGGTREDADGAGIAVIYYDKQWRPSTKDDAFYSLRLKSSNPQSTPPLLILGELSVEKLTGEEIISLALATAG